MNELLFFFHVFLVIAFLLGALSLGKNALVGLFILQGVLANLFVIKQISLFGFSVTCSDVFVIGSIFSLNLLQEYFGKEEASKAVNGSLVALLFFAVMSQIHLFYVPNAFDQTQPFFEGVLSTSFRIVFASLFTFYVVQRFDVWFFGKLKGVLPLRVAISLVVSQALDTALFTLLGLYGLVESLADVMLLSFSLKCLIVLISAPFVGLAKKIVKRKQLLPKGGSF